MTQYLTLLEGTTETPSTWATLGTFLPFLLLIPIFYFLMYRPQKKQEKETAQMRNNLTIGDEVVTIGGRGGHSGVILPWALHSEGCVEALTLPDGTIAKSLEDFKRK